GRGTRAQARPSVGTPAQPADRSQPQALHGRSDSGKEPRLRFVAGKPEAAVAGGERVRSAPNLTRRQGGRSNPRARKSPPDPLTGRRGLVMVAWTVATAGARPAATRFSKGGFMNALLGRGLTLAVLALVALSTSALAAYPERPVTLIVPWA